MGKRPQLIPPWGCLRTPEGAGGSLWTIGGQGLRHGHDQQPPLKRIALNETPRLNGEPLTAFEARALRILQERLYRDPRTGRNLRSAIGHLRASPGYIAASLDRRAALIDALRERYQRQVSQLVTEPRAPFYLRGALHRTSRARLRAEAASGSVNLQQARRRSRSYGLERWDGDVIALHDAAFA